MEKATILEYLIAEDLTWFTKLIKWKRLWRYVIWLTNNQEFSITQLSSQTSNYSKTFDNLTIGWRTHPSWDIFVDIGTSTDILSEALDLGRVFKQTAIYDLDEKVEIFI